MRVHRLSMCRPHGGRSRKRGGLLMIVSLVVLFLTTAIAASLIQLELAHRHEMQRAQRQIQADWLAESALGRAVAQFSTSEDYDGELWQPDVAGVLTDTTASARIEVKRDTGESRIRIEIVAELNRGDELVRAQRSLEIDQ